MSNIEQWKLDLVAGTTVSWSSPCPPYLTIVDSIHWIKHYPEINVTCIRFTHYSYNIYSPYEWLHKLTPSQDLYADEDAYLKSIIKAAD